MRWTNTSIFTIATLVVGLSVLSPVAAQDAPHKEVAKPASKSAPLMTMSPSPGVVVNVLKVDPLKAIQSKQPRTATMVEVVLDPLAGSPPHRHPGPVCGYVLEGTFEFQIEGKEKQVLHEGDTFFEPEMILHLVGRNPNQEGKTRVLATIIHPSDAKQLVIPEPQK